MFFVLSSGRCGSTSIASLLSQFPGVSCVHEPQPGLAYEAHAYLRGELPRKKLVTILRDTRSFDKTTHRYGESNQKLSYIIDALQEAFPKAVFLWLVRNGLDVVPSFYLRGAYREDEIKLSKNASGWIKYRLCGNEVLAMSNEEWKKLDSFARCCWFWGWTNEKIRSDLQSVGAKWMLVRLEDLDITVEKIASFLNLPPVASPMVPVLNASPSGKVLKPTYWDLSQRKNFVRFCGPMMDELYPGWRPSLDLETWQILRNELLTLFSPRHAFGRVTEKIFKMFPAHLQKPIRNLSNGRRN